MLFKDILHNETKKRALTAHKGAIEKYNGVIETVETECARLYQTRKRTIELIVIIEALINSRVNTPKEFTPTLARINIERTKFRKTEDYAAEAEKTVLKSGRYVGAGVAVGRAFGDMAPNVIMWFATTFGKASTGTAISKLSGAAKNNAIFALLGGGVKAMGGGGIKVGQARLAFAKPVGWGIVAVAAGSLLLYHTSNENKKIAGQANQEANKVTKVTEQLNKTFVDVSHRHAETEELLGRVSEQFMSLELLKDCSYVELSNDEQLQLDSLINNTLALAEMLNKVVEWSAEA
jgi:hypothetical protein